MTEGTAARHDHAPPTTGARRVVDIHAHWYPADWLKLFERDGPAEGAKLERNTSGYTIRTERIVNAFDEQFVDLGLRLDGMDRQRVDVQALSLTAPMVYWASPGFGLALAQAYNDAAAAAHASHPDRLVGLAMLPMQAPELALKELERAAGLPGMRGMYLATHVNNIDLDDRRFWDVYAKAEELGWTIFLHPIDTIGRERTTRFHLKNLLGNPYDTGVAAASLIFGGVLDAFPKLEINLPHAGGTFPWLIGRLDHGTKVRPELKHMKQLPSAYLRRFTYDTIGHNDEINANLIRLVGADRVVLGSDYCFDMGLADPLGDVERLDALTAAERDLIVGQSALRLLRLGERAAIVFPFHTRLRLQARGPDAAQSAIFVAIGCVATDSNSADNVSSLVVNEHPACHRDQAALAHRGQSAIEGRGLLRPLRHLPSRESHAQCAPRLSTRNIDAKNPRAVLALQRYVVASRVEHDHRQRRAAQFGRLAKGAVNHSKGKFQVQSCHLNPRVLQRVQAQSSAFRFCTFPSAVNHPLRRSAALTSQIAHPRTIINISQRMELATNAASSVGQGNWLKRSARPVIQCHAV